MKVTDRKAAELFLARKPGRVSKNTHVLECHGVVRLELFGNVIAWHYEDGRIDVRTTHPSYTTHMRLNALAYKLGVWRDFHAYTKNHEHFVDFKGKVYDDPRKVFTIREGGEK